MDLIMKLLTDLEDMRSAALQSIILTQPNMINGFFYSHPLIFLPQQLPYEVPAEGTIRVPNLIIELDLTSSDALDGSRVILRFKRCVSGH